MKIDQIEAGYEHLNFQAVNGIIYFPELVPGRKKTVSAQNFTFSLHVDIWW